jgi:hypothetical protein
LLDFDLVRRGQRYLSAYIWLLRQHFRFSLFPFVAYQLLAAGSRVATIAGLVSCVHLLAHLIAAVQHPASHTIGFGIEVSDSTYRTVAVVVPVTLLILAAILQRLSTVFYGRVLHGMMRSLAEDYRARTTASGIPQNFQSGSGYSALCQMLVRIELRFLLIVQNLFIIVVVIFASMLVVGPVISLGIIFVLSAFSGVFLLLRQKQAHEVQRNLNDLTRQKSAVLAALPRESGSNTAGTELVAREQLAKIAYERVYLNTAFRENSKVIVLLVQAAMISALLIYVASIHSIEPGHFAKLISMFVIVRFVFGTMQAINSLALAMAPDYPPLVRIINGQDYAGSATERVLLDELSEENEKEL